MQKWLAKQTKKLHENSDRGNRLPNRIRWPFSLKSYLYLSTFLITMTRSKSQVIHVHWFANMVNKRLLELHPGLEVSHLCHTA